MSNILTSKIILPPEPADSHVVDFDRAKFDPVPANLIDSIHDHVIRQALKNAYRYVNYLHERFGRPLSKAEKSRRIKEGMERARKSGRMAGRPAAGGEFL